MIRLFQSNRKMIFFPKKWANSVTNWLTGIHSPSGTIKIRNAASPSGKSGPTIDIDIEIVSNGVKERLNGHFTTKKDVLNEISKSIDQATIVQTNGKAQVNEAWLDEKIKEAKIDSVESPATVNTIESGFTERGGQADFSTKTDSRVFGNSEDAGIDIYLATRGADQGVYGMLAFRKFRITGNGRIYSIDGESSHMSILTEEV